MDDDKRKLQEADQEDELDSGRRAEGSWRQSCSDWLLQLQCLFHRRRNLFVLLFATASVILVGGKRRCFSIFLGELHERFNVTKLELNWIGDSYAAFGFFFMPLAATLILSFDRCYSWASLAAAALIFVSCMASSFVPSPGWLFLTHTLIHGVGSTLAMTAAALIVGEYFDRNHRFHVLTTTLVSGGPFGAILFCPLYAYWIREDGWRVAFRYMSVVFLVEMTLAGLVYKPKQLEYQDIDSQQQQLQSEQLEPKQQQQQQQQQVLQEQMRRTWAFCTWQEIKDRPQILLWIVQRTVHNVIMYSIAMNLYDLEYDTTVSQDRDHGDKHINSFAIKQTSSNMQLCYTVGESAFFLAGLLMGDRIRGSLIVVYVGGAGGLCVTLVAWFFLRHKEAAQFALALVAGASVGTGNTMVYATSEEVMHLDGSVSFPMSKLGAGIGMLLAPEFSGFVIDRLHFSGFCLVQAALCSVSLCLLLAIVALMRLQNRRRQRSESGDTMPDSAAGVQQRDSAVY